MKFTFSCFTILIILVSADCGLVKQIVGKVKEDVHSAVDKTVNIIGKGTHKLTEGLGVFLHRNEGHNFPDIKTETTPNQISNEEKIEKNNNGTSDNKHEEIVGGSKNDAQNFNHIQSTLAPVKITVDEPVPQNTHNEHTTESNYKKHPEQYESGNKENIKNHAIPTTATNVETTSETSWFNGADLENILPTITHNETHFSGNTNELGTGDLNTTNIKESNEDKYDEIDENIKPTEKSEGNNKANLVSDQMFFKDNKPKRNENNVCAEGLVRTANGECRKQIEIDMTKKVEPMVANVFQADSCASGYRRAIDGSCQRIVG